MMPIDKVNQTNFLVSIKLQREQQKAIEMHDNYTKTWMCQIKETKAIDSQIK